jgi:2-polyprenyl-6-methoxyphenol hydroxylase-like FAD-dependent oxidoreductase
VLLGDAPSAVPLTAEKDATLAMAGAVVARRRAVAEHRGGPEAASAAYEARLRPWVEAAQRTAGRNLHLFTPANRVQLLAREAVLRLAACAPLIKRLLNREEERL